MLDEKKLKQVENRIKDYLREGTIKKQKEREFVKFFLTNAENSLRTAELVLEASEKSNLDDADQYDGSLWIINTSYYSMFYVARALLESRGVKINTELSVHGVTFDALVYYFYLNGKLQKRFIEDFAEATEEVAEILSQKKAKEMVESYMYEKNKRAILTYHSGEVAMRNRAKTSLDRAKKFYDEIKKMIKIP